MTRELNILCADRELSRIEFAVDILEKEGYGVRTASNMRDALSAINAASTGLILCGLELEDVSGELFLSFLKKDPLREAIPFIFFLSLECQKKMSPKQALQMGAEDLIFFPLDAPILLSRVKDVLPPPPESDKKDIPPSVRNDATIDIQPSDQDSDEEKIVSEKRTAAPLPERKPKPHRKAANQNLRVERRAEKRTLLPLPVSVEVSPDGKTWKPGVVSNTSKSGAMIDTMLRRSYGQKILIRDPSNDRRAIVAGSVAHVLLREKSKRVGIGVVFYNTTDWLELCNHLLQRCNKENIGPISSETFPINIEVSRDGFLWTDAQITACDAAGAQINTCVLGKANDALRISFDQHGIKDIVVGRIKQVGLVNEAMRATIELDFLGDSGWLEVFAYFAALTDPMMIAKKRTESIQKKHERKTGESQEGSTHDKWSKNILVQKGADRSTESSLQSRSGQKPASKNLRFYQSLIGRTMDNYEVVSFISSGAMGGVFKGWDNALERDVALKVISWELSSQERFVKMFFKEARLVSKLNHPNVSQIYTIGNTNGIIYYAMEFVHGENLLELNKKKIVLETAQAVKYLRTVCCALDYVWKNKIIHRDIKPANIMLTNDDEPKIVDFGVAKLDSHSETKIVGSPLYLSPETILNKNVDHRSDIYALGASFYHLIAGTPPFVDISLRKILQKHLLEPVPSLKKKAPHASDALCGIIEKMMAKKSDNRYQTYRELIECLDDVACEKQLAAF